VKSVVSFFTFGITGAFSSKTGGAEGLLAAFCALLVLVKFEVVILSSSLIKVSSFNPVEEPAGFSTVRVFSREVSNRQTS
jgi:hypothetical protein